MSPYLSICLPPAYGVNRCLTFVEEANRGQNLLMVALFKGGTGDDVNLITGPKLIGWEAGQEHQQ